MTPTRDAKLSGSALREAHRRVGWYLATEFLPEVVGIGEYLIPHVQGHQTTGHRLFHDQQTSIIAVMRRGESITFDVNDAIPLATFIDANSPQDIKPSLTSTANIPSCSETVIKQWADNRDSIS